MPGEKSRRGKGREEGNRAAVTFWITAQADASETRFGDDSAAAAVRYSWTWRCVH